ncbi:LCP family glycopolymer transferase [Paenibacillus tundrae]|uniref:LCP family protein required for cell wall assembly n=1 Tax=Paenibacillus tundrae TaxID=528187 RepID=A0ABT9WAS2_9BACL|nr:LCP family protein [Paenibacillus tundrae]MDQ0170309.1 LCP family protein required for cell wall assembly [Paenibacillus tundrae]
MKLKRGIQISLAILFLMIAIVLGYAVYLYLNVKSTANDIYEPREPVKEVSIVDNRGGVGFPIDLENEEPFNALILGVDTRANDRGRSDTMIVLSVNPAQKSVLMLNIPRDTRTSIVGRGTEDKINHAYAFGGVNMSVQTVEQFLGVPMHYYLKVDMEGFARVIDLVGGVDVENPFAFEYEGHQFDKGTIHLDGASALGFSRMRYDDPKGDLGRNDRQREIIKQVLKSTVQVSTVFQLESLLGEVSEHVKTDVSFDEMKSMLAKYRNVLERVESVEIKGTGKKIDGVYYYMVEQSEKDRIHQLIKEHSG